MLIFSIILEIQLEVEWIVDCNVLLSHCISSLQSILQAILSTDGKVSFVTFIRNHSSLETQDISIAFAGLDPAFLAEFITSTLSAFRTDGNSV